MSVHRDMRSASAFGLAFRLVVEILVRLQRALDHERDASEEIG